MHAAVTSFSNNKYLICKLVSNTTAHSKNSLNPVPHILEILITQCLRREAPKPGPLLITRKKLYQ
jgi:hypothetical protein